MREIAEAIERGCREDLTKLAARTKVPREGWVRMAALVAEDETGEQWWGKHKKWLQKLAKRVKYIERNIDSLSTTARSPVRPPDLVDGRRTLPGRGFEELAGRWKADAESLRKSRNEIAKIINKNKSNHRHTIAVFLNSLDDDFDCWAALARVFQAAYRAASREKDAEDIDERILRTMFARTRDANFPEALRAKREGVKRLDRQVKENRRNDAVTNSRPSITENAPTAPGPRTDRLHDERRTRALPKGREGVRPARARDVPVRRRPRR